MRFLSFLILFLVSIPALHCFNVLFVPGHGSASHTKGMYPLAAALARRDHHVEMMQFAKIEQHKAKAPKNSQIHDRYLMLPATEEEKSFRLPQHILWGKTSLGGLSFLFPWEMFTAMCRQLLINPELKSEFYGILNERRWDLIIVDDIFAPCGMLAAGHVRRLWNASVINFGTSILVPQSQEVRSSPINKVVYPSAMLAYGFYDHTLFSHRLYNFIDFALFYPVLVALDRLVPRWLDMPPSPTTSPTLFALHADLLMSSLSPMLEFGKPMARDVIELDVDCPSRTQELPENYREFVEDPASKGTILFAMGHATNWDDVPEGVFEAFLEAFSKLSSYRVVWQYVSKNPMPKMPKHVLLDGWVPQSALLYHEKTRVFISHVGGKSLRETICARVPVVTMPMFAEQYRNAAIAWRKGISAFLDKTDLSSSTIFEAITQILNSTKHKDNIQALQSQLDDQIMKSVEVGRFWAEFLTRHKSSSIEKYFRMRVSTLSFLKLQYYDLTVLIGVAIFGAVIGLG